MTIEELRKTVDALAALPKETEWVEFKQNFHSPEEIGERLSALRSQQQCVSEGRIIWISGLDYSEGVHISMYKIPAAVDGTTKFLNQAYNRVGSLTKLLVGYPEKEAKIWRKNECRNVEDIIVKEAVDAGEVVTLLNVQTFFDKLKLPLPTTREAVMENFVMRK